MNVVRARAGSAAEMRTRTLGEIRDVVGREARRDGLGIFAVAFAWPNHFEPFGRQARADTRWGDGTCERTAISKRPPRAGSSSFPRVPSGNIMMLWPASSVRRHSSIISTMLRRLARRMSPPYFIIRPSTGA